MEIQFSLLRSIPHWSSNSQMQLQLSELPGGIRFLYVYISLLSPTLKNYHKQVDFSCRILILIVIEIMFNCCCCCWVKFQNGKTYMSLRGGVYYKRIFIRRITFFNGLYNVELRFVVVIVSLWCEIAISFIGQHTVKTEIGNKFF